MPETERNCRKQKAALPATAVLHGRIAIRIRGVGHGLYFLLHTAPILSSRASNSIYLRIELGVEGSAVCSHVNSASSTLEDLRTAFVPHADSRSCPELAEESFDSASGSKRAA